MNGIIFLRNKKRRMENYMPKTLYISDLDGTLLNSKKELSPLTRKALNRFISEGICFSVATARTAASTSKILSGIDFGLPSVLMNGAVIYDFGREEYIKIETICEKNVQIISDMINQYGISGFMYAVRDGVLVTYYENLKTKPMKDFYDERVKRYYKTFERVDSFMHKAVENNVVYFTMIDEYDTLLGTCNDLKNVDGIDSTLYRDIYAEDLWYLEVYSKNASKYNAVNFLREHYGFDRIVGYGDNHNDIPLLKACDEFFAVSNAVDELKALSTAVIESNLTDGVIKHMMERESIML